VYTSSVLRGAPYAFIKFHLLIKKKEYKEKDKEPFKQREERQWETSQGIWETKMKRVQLQKYMVKRNSNIAYHLSYRSFKNNLAKFKNQ